MHPEIGNSLELAGYAFLLFGGFLTIAPIKMWERADRPWGLTSHIKFSFGIFGIALGMLLLVLSRNYV
jgi:hypothetical protein